MYAGEADDKFPRNDGCLPGVSLNPALKPHNVQGDGCSQWPFAFRQNHYKWPIWVIAFAGHSVELFMCPSRERDTRNWNENGELMNAYALNLSLTGALNTYTQPAGPGAIRNSFLGGGITDVPSGCRARSPTFVVCRPELLHPSVPGLTDYLLPS